MSRVTWLAAAALLALAGCGPCVPQAFPPAVPDGPVAWSYIALGQDGHQLRARGFDAAAPAGAAVEVLVNGESLATGQVDARGRFDLRFDGELDSTVELVLSGGDLASPERLHFTPKDMAAARAQAVNAQLAQTGAVPNDLAVVPLDDGADAALLVVNSGDNSVDNVSMSTGQRVFSPLGLPEREDSWGSAAAQPFAIAALGAVAAVTRLGHSAVTLFDVASGAAVAEVVEDAAIALPAGFAPAEPVDGDGDGYPEDYVDRVLPRALEGLAAVGDRLFVCAANLLYGGPPAIYAPGMVLVYRWSDSGLSADSPHVLHTGYLNPQVAVAAGDLIAVVQTGSLEAGSGGWHASSDGGVELWDAATLAPVASFNLGRRAPGAAAASPDGAILYVGSLLAPELYKIDLSAMQLARGLDDPIRLFSADSVQSVFSLVVHPMGLVFASSFNTDQLFAVDGLDDAVSPWPFEAPLQVGAGGMAFGGAHAVALRPGRNGVAFQGPDLGVLLSVATRVAAVDTRWIMGP